MLVKVAPIGERVIEVNVEPGSTVEKILDIADVEPNGRTISVSNSPADLDTPVTQENSIIALAGKMKAGK